MLILIGRGTGGEVFIMNNGSCCINWQGFKEFSRKKLVKQKENEKKEQTIPLKAYHLRRELSFNFPRPFTRRRNVNVRRQVVVIRRNPKI